MCLGVQVDDLNYLGVQVDDSFYKVSELEVLRTCEISRWKHGAGRGVEKCLGGEDAGADEGTTCPPTSLILGSTKTAIMS